MPDYTIRDPQSGKTVTLRGDSPPTEQELEQVFARVNKPETNEEEPHSAATLPAAGIAAGAAPVALALAKRAAEQFATSPVVGKTLSAVAKRGAAASAPVALYQAATGDIKGAAKTAAVGAVTSQAPRVVQAVASRAATALPVASPAAIGAGAGLALPLVFLGLLQRDVNRKVEVSKDNPILKGLETAYGKR